MHRHRYKGRKFGRERDQRRALLKSLAESLIKHQSIETTLPKAKEIVPYTEKLITKAKKGGLHNRRQIIARLQTLESAHLLVDEIVPKLTARNSGHLRVERTSVRRGDNVQLARVSFVDDLSKPAPIKPAAAKSSAASIKPPTAKKPATTRRTPAKAKEAK